MRFLPAALLLPFSPAFAVTSFDVCTEPGDGNVVRAGYTAFEDASVPPAGADLVRDNWVLDVAAGMGSAWLGGGAYRGTLIDERDVGLQTNGYLHSFYFFFQRLRTPASNLRLAAAPALSGSSNVTKDPDEWEADAWQLNLAAVWRWPASGNDAWRAGLCADHRFGRYRLYPVVAYDWQPHPDWRIAAGIPDAAVTWQPADAFAATLAVYPNGNEWFVKNSALTQSSLLEYRAWAVDLVFAWHMTPALSLAATGGVDVDAEYRAALADGERTLLDAGTVARIGIELAWTF
jgi:hypothetical protein